MRINERLDNNAVADLAHQIVDLINKDRDLSHGEILLACLHMIGSILVQIKCRDCREISMRMVKEVLDDKLALLTAATPAAKPSPHVH